MEGGYEKVSANRLYNTWQNPQKLECKIVGPSSKCFCDHYYKNHDFQECKDGKVRCKHSGCSCANFTYLPTYGSQDFKCSCKHSYQNHNQGLKACKNCPCKAFTSSWSCPCGYKFGEHKNITQKAKDREDRGMSVNPAVGGIVSYSSMLDGADRYENKVNDYLKQNPDKKVPLSLLDRGKFQSPQGEITAYTLYNTPLRFGK